MAARMFRMATGGRARYGAHLRPTYGIGGGGGGGGARVTFHVNVLIGGKSRILLYAMSTV